MALGFFDATDTSDPRVNAQLRQKIALAMMAREKKFPKTLGEGLSAIGDAIGERATMKQLLQADLAQQDDALKGSRQAAAPVGYAPSGGVAAAPAAQAITRAITPAVSGVQSDEPASGGDMPVAANAPPDEGGYNALDAQAGGRFKPTPGYLQDTIAAREPNPDMQAYFGSLSGDEAPKGARDISPTGAAGPYQMTRGTGADYGVPGDARMDPGASTDAIRKFTADNAAAFQAKNGRAPTFQELAIMHQQGPQGGMNLLQGQPAPAQNLAVNNMGGFSPGQAVAKMNGFYGMPAEPAPVSSRAAIAAQLLARQQGGGGAPPPNPIQAGPATSGAAPSPSAQGQAGSPPDQRLALAAPQDARGAVTDIRPAPVVPSQLRTAPPPQQVAQAQENYPAGYVPPAAGAPPSAPVIPPSQRELEIQRWLVSRQGNPYAAAAVAPELNALIAERTQRQNEANELYKAQLLRGTAQDAERIKAQIGQQKSIADVAHTQAQTRKENIVENPEDKYMMGPDGVVRPIRVEGEDPNAVPSGKLTEDQRKTLVYHGWAKQGNQAITGNDQLLAHGLAQEVLGKVPIFGNKEQNDAYRRAKNGADNFILAFMRSTSGAQYGAVERLDHAKAMLPRYGDDAKTLADKANQRQSFIDTEYAGLGRQGQKMADYLAKTHDPDSADRRQQLIDIEMQGVKGGIPGEVKTNRKTGEQRMWNGSRWVEAR